jgi:hypothetical protein
MRGLEILANKVAAGCMHASVRTIAKRYRVPEAEALAAMDCRLTPLDLQMRLHALQLELDRLDEGLKNFFAENGEKAVGRIYFLPASEDKGEQACTFEHPSFQRLRSIGFYLTESRYGKSLVSFRHHCRICRAQSGGCPNQPDPKNL